MDARIARLIIEANEISKYLKKDYVFTSDKIEDPANGGHVQVTSKLLKVNSKLPISTFKDKLVILRRLMYEDPSDAGLSEADDIIRKGHLQPEIPRVDHDEEATEKMQFNQNNCSSIPDSSDSNNNSPNRNVKTTKSVETHRPLQHAPQHKPTTNGNLPEQNSNVGNESGDQWKPKELPRRKSLKKFQGIPEQAFLNSPKISEPAIPVISEKLEAKSNPNKMNDSNFQMFLKVCGSATSMIEKNLQDESQHEPLFCRKSLHSLNTLLEILMFFKKPHFGKLTEEFEFRCMQVVAHLQLLGIAFSHIASSKELEMHNNSLQMVDSQPIELSDSLQNFITSFSNLWKDLSENTSTLGQQVQASIKPLLKLVGHLGILSTTLGHTCPLSPKIQSEIKREFMNGCDKAAFSKIEVNLSVVNRCFNLLESEADDQKQMDNDKIGRTLLRTVIGLVRLVKQLLMMARQIQEELRSTETVQVGEHSEILYEQNINTLASSTKLTDHTEALTKSAITLMSAMDVTILTLKRVSKNVAQVEEASGMVTSSFLQGATESIMAQDQMEALTEVQMLIDACCLDLRSLLLDGVSLGMSKEEVSSPLSSNPHHSFSMMSRNAHKRILPATPRDHLKQTAHTTSLVSESKVFRHINRSPAAELTTRTPLTRKQANLDHFEESSAFERPDHRNSGVLDGYKRLDILGEEVTKDASPTTSNPGGFVSLRRNPNILRYYAHRHSFMQ